MPIYAWLHAISDLRNSSFNMTVHAHNTHMYIYNDTQSRNIRLKAFVFVASTNHCDTINSKFPHISLLRLRHCTSANIADAHISSAYRNEEQDGGTPRTLVRRWMAAGVALSGNSMRTIADEWMEWSSGAADTDVADTSSGSVDGGACEGVAT